jgi:hypothetical protein
MSRVSKPDYGRKVGSGFQGGKSLYTSLKIQIINANSINK